MLILLLGCLAFVAAGVFLIRTGEPWAGWLGLVFFGICAFVTTAQMLAPRPPVTIGEQGYTDQSDPYSARWVRWSEVRRVRIIVLHGAAAGHRARGPRCHFRSTRPSPLARAPQPLESVYVGEQTLPYALETLIEVIRRHNPDVEVVTTDDE